MLDGSLHSTPHALMTQQFGRETGNLHYIIEPGHLLLIFIFLRIALPKGVIFRSSRPTWSQIFMQWISDILQKRWKYIAQKMLEIKSWNLIWVLWPKSSVLSNQSMYPFLVYHIFNDFKIEIIIYKIVIWYGNL